MYSYRMFMFLLCVVRIHHYILIKTEEKKKRINKHIFIKNKCIFIYTFLVIKYITYPSFYI